MKKKLLMALIIGLMAVFAVSADSAVGTWKGTASLEGLGITTTTVACNFKEDGTFTVTLETRALVLRTSTETYSGTWTQSGNTITVRNNSSELSNSGTIDGDKMIIPIMFGTGRVTGYYDVELTRGD
jgi:hypothetical protein